MSLKIPAFFVSLLFGAQASLAAPLSLSPKGVIINNGVDTPLTITYPVIANEARKEAKVAEASVTGTTAVVSYEGGGKLTVQIANDEVTFNVSELPAGSKHLHSATNIGPEYRNGGKWQIGTGAPTSFPVDKPASPFLHKGGSPDFTLFGPTGVQTVFHASEYAYQQLNDNREWHADIFQWHVWIPIPAGASSVTLKVTSSAAATGATSSPVAPVAAPAPVSLKAIQQPAELDAAFTGMIERPPFTGPPFQYKTIPEMNQLVDLAIKTGEMKSLVFHGVGGDWLITPLDYFAAVLDKLDANRDQLWLTDPLSYHKYLTERTTAVAREISSTPKRIQISLTSQADPVFYDLPLSLATRVPADWAHAAVQQGKSRLTIPVVAGIARYDAFPGAGEIVLVPAPGP